MYTVKVGEPYSTSCRCLTQYAGTASQMSRNRTKGFEPPQVTSTRRSRSVNAITAEAMPRRLNRVRSPQDLKGSSDNTVVVNSHPFMG